MFFQEAPPDTSAYMIAGYATFFLISAIYVLSLFIRQRNLEQDLKTLETIEAEGRGGSAGPAGSGTPRRRAGRKKVTRPK